MAKNETKHGNLKHTQVRLNMEQVRFLCCPRRGKSHESLDKSDEDCLKDHAGSQEKKVNGSIYHDALQSEMLNQVELTSLAAFENAFLNSSTHSKSIYFDAAEVESSPLYPYAPASTYQRPLASLDLDKPESLLASYEADKAHSDGVEKRWKSAKLQNTMIVKQGLDDPRVNYQDRGYPGELTKEELSACLRFRSELNQRKTDGESRYREIVDAFHGIEEEPYALCRFLRARKFNVQAVFEMMGESLDVWREASSFDFYPDPDEAIGAPISVLLTQYPFLYSGVAKNGSGVSYFRAGKLKVEGIDCVTDFENLSNLIWHNAMHGFPREIAKVRARDPDGARCESIAVFDLEGLAASNLNARTYEVLKAATKVNICFPEILNACVVLNSPSYFSFFWRVIKGILDPRTASKISIFSNKQKGEKWLLDHVKKEELLSDYGGSGPSFNEVMQNQGKDSKTFRRKLDELVAIPQRSKREVKFELADNETVALQLYTRSVSGANVALFCGNKLMKELEVKKNVSTGAYSADIASGVSGPGSFRLVIKLKGGDSTPDHFLLIGLIN